MTHTLDITDAVRFLRKRIDLDLAEQWGEERFATELLAYLRSRTAPKLLFSPDTLSHIDALARQYDPDEYAWERRIADEAVAGRLYAATNPYCDRFVEVDRDAFDFSAYPHEDPQALYGLNRMRWLAALARNYWADRDPRYFDALLREWDFFCEKVPFPGEDFLAGMHVIGPRGLTPPYAELDIFIRLTNWYWAYWLAVFAEEMTPERNAVLLARCLRLFDIVAARGVHTHEHNFTAMQMEALYLWASALPEFTAMTVWKHAARNIMEGSLRRAILPDGVQWEMSVSYHVGCIRWYGVSYLLGLRNNEPWADEYGARLLKMGAFLEQMVMPDGLELTLSDSDRTTSWKAGLSLLKAIFPQAAFEMPVDPSYYSLWASDGVTWEGAELQPPRPWAVFPESGVAVARTSRSSGAAVAVLDNGPSHAHHAHEDNLTVNYEALGRIIITDPGRWIYVNDPDRRWVCGTPAHNTVWIEDEPVSMATFEDESGALRNRWHLPIHQLDGIRAASPSACETEEYIRLEAVFAAFPQDPEARVPRHVYCGRDEARPWLVVLDNIHSPRPHQWTESWLFPTATPLQSTAWGYQFAFPDGVTLALAATPGLTLRDEEQFWCIQYATKDPARWVRFSAETTSTYRAFTVVPSKGETRIPSLEVTETAAILRVDGQEITLK